MCNVKYVKLYSLITLKLHRNPLYSREIVKIIFYSSSSSGERTAGCDGLLMSSHSPKYLTASVPTGLTLHNSAKPVINN